MHVLVLKCFNTSVCSQIDEIVGRFGLVVVSRIGYNPQRFIYKSPILLRHQVRHHCKYIILLDNCLNFLHDRTTLKL